MLPVCRGILDDAERESIHGYPTPSTVVMSIISYMALLSSANKICSMKGKARLTEPVGARTCVELVSNYTYSLSASFW